MNSYMKRKGKIERKHKNPLIGDTEISMIKSLFLQFV